MTARYDGVPVCGRLEAIVRLVGVIFDDLPHLLPPSLPGSTWPVEPQEVRPSCRSPQGKINSQEDALPSFRLRDCRKVLL
jgi:hypothetical protein